MFGVMVAAMAGATPAIHSGAVWTDVAGRPIEAHSAGLIRSPIDHVFYWYGAEGYTAGDGVNAQINVYSSLDLSTWTKRGVALNANATNATYLDRPKVVFNPKTSMFVMYCKSAPYVTVSTSKTPVGPFSAHRTFLPADNWSGDITVFVDPASAKNEAYLLYSAKPGGPHKLSRSIRIAALDPTDWLSVTGEVGKIDLPREAPAVFYDDGYYYVWTSHATGWTANAAQAFRAKTLRTAEWTDLGNPTNNASSFGSQSTYILTLGENDVPRHVYIADRFEPYISEKVDPRYVWLPLGVNANGSLSVQWSDAWAPTLAPPQ